MCVCVCVGGGGGAHLISNEVGGRGRGYCEAGATS